MSKSIHSPKFLAKKSLALAICCLAASCSNNSVQTLADLPSTALPAEPSSVSVQAPVLDISALQRSYEQALASNGDPHTRRQIRLRLADLEMERLEQQLTENPQLAVSFGSAARQYEALAQEAPRDDYILYRLARARALDGQPQASLQALEGIAATAPQSPFITEVLFRRGEAAFNRRDYTAAARDFRALLEHGDSPFADNARYMLAWSEFKSSDYRTSTQTFLQLLDLLYQRAPFAELPQGQQRLADDSLRGLALDFSYQGGAAVIETFNPDGAARAFQHELYRALGDWYREKERYRDSADTYLSYVEHYPESAEAPALHLQAVETLQSAGLNGEVLPAKREFVRRYGVRSTYWAQADEPQREKLRGWLRPWLEELARYDHARAQALAAQAGKITDIKKRREQQNVAAESRRAYLAAAELYQQYEETFPADPQTPPLVFLMAECLEQAGDYARAWEAYSRVAWEYRDKTHGAEAGYAAILSSAQVQKQLHKQAADSVEAESLWQERNIAASLKFADAWPQDARALPVLVAAADKLLQQSRYVDAITAAVRADGWQPPPNPQQQLNIAMILGHSHFEVRNYALAEQAYARVLNNSSADATLRDTARQRLQAAIYRQAELALADGPNERGLQHLLRVRDSGRSEIAATAQYDAINHLIELQQWQRAGAELADFRQYYPAHPLTPTLAAKAVVIFRALEMPAAAAGELLRLAQSDPDSEVRRQSLYMAAESFQQAGDRQQAIDAYRRYSEQWQQPAEQRLEAQFQLTQLHAQTEEHRERNRWLQQLADNRVDSPRGRYLAAYSQSELAEQSYRSFANLPLRLPLKTSLAGKKRAMDATVADYRKVLKFNIAEFTTQANFRLAEVYRQLSRDLMESQRPQNLNELELEQYEILLEEQAYPFEEKAIELHEANIQRTSDGIYDDWVKRSFDSLGKLLPARYQKQENILGWSDALH
ncbi:Tetratricopeptide repeat-containing protein [Microbulbifer donghaiensis]|uniref:Tetratricopeptide repeat-containing protein n=1 Tax=Microbulbifer donghaiensis TaxID=494016 RepID=A0A1M5A280_9GAMM|nr:tetratricopeptide repeat protein [Microbulbifer donghaiensis]SHF23912.1 Tetratricopeptide repeat-containing protein [Microbulbifer donghaiensis]